LGAHLWAWARSRNRLGAGGASWGPSWAAEYSYNV
jgi:hypothetical protein